MSSSFEGRDWILKQDSLEPKKYAEVYQHSMEAELTKQHEKKRKYK